MLGMFSENSLTVAFHSAHKIQPLLTSLSGFILNIPCLLKSLSARLVNRKVWGSYRNTTVLTGWGGKIPLRSKFPASPQHSPSICLQFVSRVAVPLKRPHVSQEVPVRWNTWETPTLAENRKVLPAQVNSHLALDQVNLSFKDYQPCSERFLGL